MKARILPIILLLAAISLSAQANSTEEYKIGDTGPGGGTVFSILKGNAWEVSEPLRPMVWNNAFKEASKYRGGGYDDWYLPTKDELESIYYNLVKPGILKAEEIYWSSNQEENMAYWGYNFKKGRPGLYGGSKVHAVRAVRHFKLD